MSQKLAAKLGIDSNLDLIKMKAWMYLHKFKKPSLYEFEDLVNEGVFVFLRARKNYSSEKNCTFRTYLSNAVENHFKNLLDKSYRTVNHVHLNYNHNDYGVLNQPLEVVSVLSEVMSMNDDERRYLNFILEPPKETIKELAQCSKKEVLSKIREILELCPLTERKLRSSIINKLLGKEKPKRTKTEAKPEASSKQ